MNDRLVMRLHARAQTKVKVGNGISDRLSDEVGVHQESVLSPFAIVMDALCEEVR